MIDVEQFLRLTEFRKRMVKAVPWTVTERRKYAQSLRESEQEETEKIANDQWGSTLSLQAFKHQLTSENGRVPSLPYLTGSYIARLGWERFEDIFKALSSLDPENPNEEVLRTNVAKFDASMGVTATGGSVVLAEGEIRKGAEQVAIESVELFERITGTEDLVGQALLYLNIRRFTKDFSTRLKNEPTGFGLIDYIAPTTKKEPTIIYPTPPHMIRDFVAIGAQAAARRYKILYPWA